MRQYILTIKVKIDIIIYKEVEMLKKKEPTETLTLRIPQSLKLQIEMAANKDGRTINSWVNKIMREYFETEKNREHRN